MSECRVPTPWPVGLCNSMPPQHAAAEWHAVNQVQWKYRLYYRPTGTAWSTLRHVSVSTALSSHYIAFDFRWLRQVFHARKSRSLVLWWLLDRGLNSSSDPVLRAITSLNPYDSTQLNWFWNLQKLTTGKNWAVFSWIESDRALWSHWSVLYRKAPNTVGLLLPYERQQ